ncbi:hypothetical protein SeLEV6574_g04455 [Synchytrium endobioticum]|nr:hypothetical protein SeLEV6574_g04455 [Synchytrium endobioticum]
MLWVRANPEDYNEWEQKLGLTGWGWNTIEKYYKKCEKYRIPLDEIDQGCHGFDGPLGITRTGNGVVNPLTLAYVKAAAQYGLGLGKDGVTDANAPKSAAQLSPMGIDYNGHTQFGSGVSHTTVYKGDRMSTSRGYVWPFIDPRSRSYRPNLTVATNAHVSRVLFQGKRAVGVAYLVAGSSKEHIFWARQQVILSAGAIQTPQILMLSGIGAKEELNKHDIPVVADLPGVGKNLQDHLFALSPFLDSSNSAYRDGDLGLLINGFYQYLTGHRGVITTSPVQALSFFSTENYLKRLSKRDPMRPPPPPNVEIHIVPATFSAEVIRTLRIDSAVIEPLGEVKPNKVFNVNDLRNKSHVIRLSEMGGTVPRFFLPLVSLIKPQSRGTINIRSSNPLDAPLIDPRYFSVKDDLDDMVDAYIQMRGIIAIMCKNGFPLQEWTDQGIVDEIVRVKECSREEAFNSRDYIAEQLRRVAVTIYHPVGTAKMATDDDPMGVVDIKCRVRGIEGLRVVDASIIPIITAGNTNGPAIVVAEVASDIIREDLARQAFALARL